MPPICAVFAASSIVTPSAPATHGLPMPRATTAACDVMPPWTVRIPCAAIIPWMSSGVVSQRTRTTASPAPPRSAAVSASKTTPPHAAPGDAFSPFAATSSSRIRVDPRMQQLVERRRDRCARRASSRVISPSSTIETAAFSAAAAVRFALRVWSRKSFPSSTVNSMSCMSR